MVQFEKVLILLYQNFIFIIIFICSYLDSFGYCKSDPQWHLQDMECHQKLQEGCHKLGTFVVFQFHKLQNKKWSLSILPNYHQLKIEINKDTINCVKLSKILYMICSKIGCSYENYFTFFPVTLKKKDFSWDNWKTIIC